VLLRAELVPFGDIASASLVTVMAVQFADLIGWWDLSWKGGTFEICLRPAGYFYCAKFQAPARWELDELYDGCVKVDWGKFGKYEFETKDGKYMEGHVLPKDPADDSNWRKAVFNRPLSTEELALIGDGAGSEWDFEWSGGKFPIKFKADGYNHFNCDDFPAHAHWSIEGNKLRINWAEYGNYDLVVDGEAKTMVGALVDGDPEKDWRKGVHVRNLLDNKVMEHCEHHH